jgi:hypothetical protein
MGLAEAWSAFATFADDIAKANIAVMQSGGK